MDDWRAIAHAIDSGAFEVTDWEASFLNAIMAWRGALTPKQLQRLTQMAEQYIGLEAAAELRGQQRLFTTDTET